MLSCRALFRLGGILSHGLIVLGAIVGLGVFAALGASQSARADDMPAPSLKHGINLSDWFADAGRQPLVARDFDQIKAAGFDHVRIPINPESLGFSLSEGSTGRVLFDFDALDGAVNLAREKGLSVIIDIHPGDGFMSALEQDPRGPAGLIALWGHLADHYRLYSTGTVVFEILNEPRYVADPQMYKGMVTDVVGAIRAVSPNNTIIVDVPKSATLEGFDGFAPLVDDKVIYAFHFYDPYIVTHQGLKVPPAKGRAIRYFHNLPYPSNAADANGNYAPGASDPADAKQLLAAYIGGNWDAARIAARIKPAADWAAANHRHVICTEFGAVRKSMVPQARYQWIADTRKALEAADIGWDLWDYTDLFGITTLSGDTMTDSSDGSVRLTDPATGTRDIEPDAVKALFGKN